MTEQTEAVSPSRTFWPTDHQRLASVVREARKDTPGITADALADAITAILAADSADFDAATWLASTYTRPAYIASLARALKQARHVRCEPYTPKSAEHQAKVDALAADADAVLIAAGIPGFDPEKFLAGTQLPGHHLLGIAGYDPDDDGGQDDGGQDDADTG